MIQSNSWLWLYSTMLCTNNSSKSERPHLIGRQKLMEQIGRSNRMAWT
jgi:hypothetical protein